MKLKMKLKNFRRLLVTGALQEERPQLAFTLSWLLNFLLGLILAAVPMGGGSGPFGLAAVAQAGTGMGGLLCAVGAICGYFLAFELHISIRNVVAVILIFTANFAARETRLQRRTFFHPALAAVMSLLTCFLGKLEADAGQNLLYPLVSEPVLAFGCTYFFREAFNTGERLTESSELRHGLSLTVLAACLLMSLSGLEILHILSVGRTLSVLTVLMIAFRAGPLPGGAAGLVLGLAMDAASGKGLFFSAVYGVGALFAGTFSKRGKLVFLICSFLCVALAVFCTVGSGARTEAFYENFVASVIFLLLPASVFRRFRSVFGMSSVSPGESGLRRFTARRISRMSEAFRDLYDTVDAELRPGKNDENISSVFDRASELVCSRCSEKSKCWNQNYLDTLSAFDDVTENIRSSGLLRAEELPQHFREACLSPETLTDAVNAELRGLTYRQQFQARLSENRCAAYQQYLDVSEILTDVSAELENAYGPDALTQRRLRRFLDSFELEADISAFRDRGGRLHILLESTKLRSLLDEPDYMDRLSRAVGVRLCRPIGSDGSTEGRITLMEAEPLSVSVGVASMKKSGETISGDRGTYFKTEQGLLCILLSDGMGSGEGAAKESVAAVRILERFLRSGVEPALAMRMLNSVMLLKNQDSWGFATVDLLCIDLFSGNAAFYKYGAAPSYARVGKQIRRVKSENLACGLSSGKNTVPDTVKMRLRPGSVAVIASDGVIAETNDDWVRKMLSETEGRDMKALAKELLQAALKQYGASDDMTVLTVRVDKRA